ncbi:FIG00800872: hypothetical protein [hydrothermal vent metagenome]|uniref:Class I SAM-dependent methyltransferase n=1 Tax=hydrothermal vent metagenome TaxID=652676 RepID=A0A3B0TKE8_9ZZZZ
MTVRNPLRRLWQGLATVTGLRALGFFIPYRYAATVRAEPYRALEPVFKAAEPRMRSLFKSIETHAGVLAGFEGPPPEPKIEQNWFARLDAAAAYAMVRHRRPRHIVEIGSGHSTRFMARAVKDEGLATAITCIDPAPRAAILGLALNHIPKVLAEADVSVFETLGPGDILFIDSSHIAMPGTDVDRLFGDVLPRLPVGVAVHIHDIVLPDAYPQSWTWRGYNEQLAVACLLQGGFELLWSSHWVASRHGDWIEAGPVAEIPKRVEVMETSIWLEKRRSASTTQS